MDSIAKVERDIDRCQQYIRPRSPQFNVERIKDLLASLGDLTQRENILAVFEKLRGHSNIPHDLTVGPLVILGQVLCNMIQEERAPFYQSMIVTNGKWAHRTTKNLMVAFECLVAAKRLGGHFDESELVSRLADRLSNISTPKKIPDDEEDVTKLFGSRDELSRLNQHVAEALMLSEEATARDLEDLAMSMARAGVPAGPRQSLLGLGSFIRPHNCESTFNHICPASLEEILLSVEKLCARLNVLLEQFPEHDLLQTLDKMCQRLKNTPMTEASLFGISSQLEVLLGRLQAWQNLCVKSDSLSTEIDELMDRLFALRKSEMESWKQLRGHIAESHRRSGLRLWGWLARLLLSSFKSREDLLSLLDTFLVACPAGEFEARLKLLKHVCIYKAVPSANRIIAENVSRYYRQFIPALQKHLDTVCEPLLQELKGFLASIRWNDKNIVAHVESSKKVHSQVIKSFKAIQESYEMSMSVTLPKLRPVKTESPIKSVDVPSDHIIPDLDAVTVQIFERMADLKALTTKDSIKQKQNAVVELFKLLKYVGIKLHRQFEPETYSIKALILGLPAIPASDDYVFKGLIAWNEIQTLLNSAHEDYGLRQVEMFKTAIIQLLHYTTALYSSRISNETLAQASNVDRVLKLLSMNRALLMEVSLVSSSSSYAAELNVLDSALSAVQKAGSIPDDIHDELRMLSFAFEMEFSLVGEQVLLNHRRLLTLLSRPLSVGSVSAIVSEPETIVFNETTEYEMPGNYLSTLVQNAERLSNEQIAEHGRKLGKFTYVLSMIFAELLRNGFCRPVEEEEAAGQEGDSMETADGVGMAQGTGQKDVSNEMEFEEQITDLQGETPEKPEDAPEMEENGLDMDQDFDAQLEDLVEDEKDEEGEVKGSDDEEDKQQPKDEAGEHEGMDDQDNIDMDLENENEKDIGELEELDSDIEKHAQEGQKEFGENDDSRDFDDKVDDELDNQMEDHQDEEELVESDADLDPEDLPEYENMVEDQEMSEGGEEEAESMQDDVQPDDEAIDEPQQEDEDEVMIDTTKDAANAGEDSSEQTPDMKPAKGTKDGEEAEGQQSIPNESAVSDAQNDSSQQHSGSQALDQVLKDIFKSVHCIMEEDKSKEKSAPASMDFSRQQQFEHSTDIDTSIGLVAPTRQDDENMLRDKIELAEQADKDQQEENDAEMQEAPESEGNEKAIAGKSTKDASIDPKEIKEKTADQGEQAFDWDRIEADVSQLSGELCEQLRLIMEPTKAAKLKGDYKTGKRLNLRKLIPYIISQYRKDKIWLRRTKPSKRTYRVALSVDNSHSMKDNGCVLLALKSVSLVSQALHKLEAGKLAVFGFGDQAKELVSFNDTTISGRNLIDQLPFNSNETNMNHLMETVISSFENESGRSDDFPWNLNIIISDGICEDHTSLRTKINEAFEKRIMNIFVILDSRSEKDSITELSKVQYVPLHDAQGLPTGKTTIKMQKYLETFPFENYIVAKNVNELPTILSDAIKQWFEIITTVE